MQVLFIHTIGKRKFGGGERWVVQAAAGLQQLGHKVFVVSKPGSILLQKAMEKGVSVKPMNILSDISIYHAVRLAGFIRKNKIDVVISKRRDLAVAGLAARLGGWPAVIVRSGAPPQKSLRKHVFLINSLADGLLTNTITIRELYKQHGLPVDDFVEVMYNGVVTDDEITAFDFQRLFPGKKIILLAGRLNAANKGYYYLIDAMSMLKSELLRLHFYILGDGKDKKQLVEYARKKDVSGSITFAGYVDKPAAYMRACDVFLHTSLYEGMPNAVMEAMAYARPVIMTDVNGARELSDNGKHAMVIPPADAAAIADALKTMLSAPEKYRLMAQEAQKHVRKTFSQEKMIRHLEAFLIEKIKTVKDDN